MRGIEDGGSGCGLGSICATAWMGWVLTTRGLCVDWIQFLEFFCDVIYGRPNTFCGCIFNTSAIN